MKCVELRWLDSILLAVGNSSFPTAVGSCGIPAARASRVISVARTLIMNMINTMVFFQKHSWMIFKLELRCVGCKQIRQMNAPREGGQ